MIIKPSQGINPLDRKIPKHTQKKSDSHSEEATFESLLDEVDIIRISSKEENTADQEQKPKKEEKKKELTDDQPKKLKLDKFA